MTYNEESSVLECISGHFKSIFKNDKSVDFNNGYNFWWLSWDVTMSKSSLFRPMILSAHIKWVFWFILIYKSFMPKFFFHNSGSNQDIFILFEDLSSVWLDLFEGYLNL